MGGVAPSRSNWGLEYAGCHDPRGEERYGRLSGGVHRQARFRFRQCDQGEGFSPPGFQPRYDEPMGFCGPPPVLRAAAKWFDVLHVGYQEGPVFPDERLAAPSATYDITGKPMMYWIGFTANKDS